MLPKEGEGTVLKIIFVILALVFVVLVLDICLNDTDGDD